MVFDPFKAFARGLQLGKIVVGVLVCPDDRGDH
ncbi:hypothetical protein SDC9_172963 [bioreactor metagenome]|uniref:Uncharacterized protein n=1 Tax=bioreactor metagenome TaxID=1076179 RepID=A0A645GF57_9ZZZZ